MTLTGIPIGKDMMNCRDVNFTNVPCARKQRPDHLSLSKLPHMNRLYRHKHCMLKEPKLHATKVLAVIGLSLATMGAVAAETAQSFPSRPIKLIVPTAPGGSMDVMARVVAENARKPLGQPIVIENKPGAGNTMAAVSMVSAEPDGYTLGLISCATLKLPHVSKTQYDPMKDLTYISRISDFALIVAVREDAPYKNMKDLVSESRKEPLFYGTAGKFNSPHLATVRLSQATGAQWTDVAYKGDSDAITALLGGQVQFIATSNSALPFVESGKLRALGVYSDKRGMGALEKVPTMSEQGLPVVDTCPFGIMGPKGMDPAIVKKLDAAFRVAINAPGTHTTAEKFGFSPDYLDAAGFDRWARESFESDRVLFQKLEKKPE